MTAFYVCIILIGVLITAFSLVLIMHDKKKAHDYRLDIDERKHDLMHVLDDAEQLISELNKYSDYIVQSMEEKQVSLKETICEAEEKIDLIKILIFQDSLKHHLLTI